MHVLTWMSLAHRHGRDVVTSDQVAASVNTNAVVIRRTLGRLRDAGLVDVQRGQGAGWRLARAPKDITLLEVYQAVEEDALFALHHGTPNQECPVGRGIQPVLRHVYDGVEDSVRGELAKTSIADVLAETVA